MLQPRALDWSLAELCSGVWTLSLKNPTLWLLWSPSRFKLCAVCIYSATRCGSQSGNRPLLRMEMNMRSLAGILQIQAHAVFHLLRVGKTNSLFPVSVYSEFALQALSIQHLVVSVSCLQNNSESSAGKCLALFLKAADSPTHKKPDVTYTLAGSSVCATRALWGQLWCTGA